MENTNTDARKAARKPGFYWVRKFRWEVAEYTAHGQWYTTPSRVPIDEVAWKEIDETPITRQSRPATLDEREVSIIFKNPEGITKTLDTHLMDLLNKMPDDFYEELEDGCTSASCNNESQNFCDCRGQFEDYEIYDVVIKSLSEQPEAKPAEPEQVDIMPCPWRNDTKEYNNGVCAMCDFEAQQNYTRITSEQMEKLKAALETIKNFDSRKGFGMKQVASEALNSLKQ